MVFSSLVFLARFLPITVILYVIAPNMKIKNLVLIAASLFFYAWGEPVWVILLILSTFTDFICGGLAGKYQNTKKGKAFLVISLVLNLGILALFKYGSFFVGNINWMLGLHIPDPGISLPIGISFYTMQTITYTIDAYRGKVKVQKSFADFLLFVSMFPQLVAGPIVRYEEIETQLAERKITIDNIYTGVTRFVLGLAKKTLIANYAGFLAAKFLDGDLLGQSSSEVWLGLLFYTFQIYFDFSGYSDMAIGLGSMFGFKFPENFNHPYISQSITEFWRRWHMTLSGFFRDYVYIPMGGNRRHQYRNILIVWMLTGFWHGASWNFVIWGLYFAVILAIEKKFMLKALEKVPRALRIAYSFLLVMFGFNFFYFVDPNRNLNALRVMFGFAGSAFSPVDMLKLFANYLPFIAVCVICAIPARSYLLEKAGNIKLPDWVRTAGVTVCMAAALVLSTASIVSNSYNPFIYFRF
ncbi:MAG TPA: MBOAT family O-acyltransferase [Clostridia bacterium]|nr:MBOAT family O-acyltransferase [Clostridia bacterium]